MNKPQLILDLEKELHFSLKRVELNKIAETNSVRTHKYSVDETGNIIGIAIHFGLKEIPQTLTKFKTGLFILIINTNNIFLIVLCNIFYIFAKKIFI